MCHIWISWSVAVPCSSQHQVSWFRPRRQFWPIGPQIYCSQQRGILSDSYSWYEMQAHTVATTLMNNNILVVAFAQGPPFAAVIYKHSFHLQTGWEASGHGAAPWVQCYLLSQPRQGASPGRITAVTVTVVWSSPSATRLSAAAPLCLELG